MFPRRQFLSLVAAGLVVGGRRADADAGGGLPAWGEPKPTDLELGTRALRRHCTGHGGRAAWETLPPLQCDLHLTWTTAARMWRPPMPSAPHGMRFTVHFHQDKARLDFGDAAQTCWAHDSVEAWTARHGRRTYPHAHHAGRLIPALKWYAAMPHKLLDPGVLHQQVSKDSGRVLVRFATTGGQTGDRMLATFAAGRLIALRHTARAFGEHVLAEAQFVAWTDLDGVALPAEVRVSVQSPAQVHDAQVVRFEGWRTATPPPGFFEKPPE